MATFPDGTKFYIADGTSESATLILVEGFEDIGDVGLQTELVDATVLSDDSEVFGVVSRKTGGERDLMFRLQTDDAGQAAVKAACTAQERRACEVRLPSAGTWKFTALFGGWTIPKPESKKHLSLQVKIAIETEEATAG